MTPLLSLEEKDALDSGYESYDEPISTEMLEDIRNRSQSHPNINRIKARYKIRGHIKQRQLEVSLNMGKSSHKMFKSVVKDISQ